MEHIVLTVGANELPVLVAARYLYVHSAGRRARVTMVVSSETADEGERVKRALNAKLGRVNWGADICVDPYDPICIRAQAERFRESMGELDTVHVNYTGGTKAMAVHIMEGLAVKRPHESYLDPVIHVLRQPGIGQSGDLRLEWLGLTVRDLAELHNQRWESYGGGRLTGLDREIFEAFSRALTRRPSADLRHTVQVGNGLLPIAAALGYQLVVVRRAPGPTGDGYQKLCKIAGFETYHRARQCGGDRAQAVVVTRLDPAGVARLKDDLRLDIGQSEPVHCWGATEAADLEWQFNNLLDELNWS